MTARYRLLEHGGFVAHFTVEVVYDLNASGTGHDRVGISVRCQHCGERLGKVDGADLAMAMELHAGWHAPDLKGERP